MPRIPETTAKFKEEEEERKGNSYLQPFGEHIRIYAIDSIAIRNFARRPEIDDNVHLSFTTDEIFFALA